MKIAFLLGGLEAGTTGVGDYIRLVADELVAQGHQCYLLALNDRALTQAPTEPVRETTTGGVPILRLPAELSWDEKVQRAKAAIDEFNPDWISWQFVCYSYHPKGIVTGLEKHMAPIIGNRPLHVMFHELWIGYGQAPFKEKVVGKLQSRAIARLMKALRPRVSHTSNDLYAQRLKSIGIEASVLPLFSNVPIGMQNANSWLWPMLNEKGLEISAQTRSEYWIFCFFGALFLLWAPEPFFTYIQEAAAKTNRRVVIISMGRIGEGESLWKELTERYTNFTFLALGGLPGDKVSQVLNSVDFGVSATPYALVGKSSSTATMLESGLPVFVTRDDVQGADNKNSATTYNKPNNGTDSQLIKMDDTLSALLVAGLPRQVPTPRLPLVVKQLVESLH